MNTHDPARFIGQLRQTLSADRLAVGFLLGAGCPCSIRVDDDKPLIPNIAGLTALVDAQVAAGDLGDSYRTLMAGFVEDGVEGPTIEAILNRVRALRDVAGSAQVRGVSFVQLDALDRTICDLVRRAVNRELPGTDSPYHDLARFVGSGRQPAVELFTTNYDLLIEQALEDQKVPFFDGFIGSSKPFFDQRAIEEDEIPKRWARLWKLHGSANWRLKKDRGGVVRSEKCEDGEEVLIHPSHMKYDESRRMPYFVMIDRLRAFLRNGERPVALIVVGYAFGDQHLNEAIVEALRFNPSSACFALQYDNIAAYPDAAKLAKANPNLSLLARDGAIIRRRPGDWVTSRATDPSLLGGAFELIHAGDEDTRDADDAPTPTRMTLGDFRNLGQFLDSFAAYGSRASDEH